jgi:gluconokinase
MVIVLFGVAGCGKTMIGKLLADTLGWRFLDADDYHSRANVAKMAGGIPLDDDDRSEWLTALREIIEAAVEEQQNLILACSALKASYREQLSIKGEVKFVLLEAEREIIRERLLARKGHFMGPELLQSQFDTLEADQWVDLAIDASSSPELCVAKIGKLA